jgi:tetratricopeptide (TPR) repeat protein
MGSQDRRVVAAEQARQVLATGDVEQSLRICLEYGCSPYTATAIQMRAMLELRKGNFAEAEKFVAQAIRMRQDPISYKIAGDAAFLQCRYEDAEKNYRLTLERHPTMHETWHDLGVAVVSQGKVSESLQYFTKAIEMQPERADYHHHLSLMLLLDGQEDAGWDRMQWRLRVPGVCGSFPNQERYWRGESLAGKTIIVRTEQGWGDAIMFAGYLPWLAKEAKKVYIFCQRALLGWFEHYFPMVEAWPNDAPPPLNFDYHVNIMCFPRLIPFSAYALPRALGARGDGIGVNWFGSPTHKADHLRSVPIERFAPIAEAAEQKLYCLGYGRFDAKPDFIEYLIDGCRDWLETSRIVREMDLIITVDTAIAHLGGFLGVETWLLLPYVPDFRWGMQGERTKWYESVKLYRQPKLFDWDSVFARVTEDVRARYVTTQAVGGDITTAAAS